MEAFQTLAGEHDLLVFEDAAQARNATLNGQKAGTFGTGSFSLYPTKNMTSGEGGMITTRDAEIARRARILRNQGMETQYANELVGLNNRMTDIHASIGRVQLKKLEGWTKQCQTNAAFLSENLENVIAPPVAEGAVHVYHQYTIRVPEDRDGFVKKLREGFKVGSSVYYPIPNHRLLSLKKFTPGLELPVTEEAAAQVVSLPVHASLTQNDLERIVEAVNETAGAEA